MRYICTLRSLYGTQRGWSLYWWKKLFFHLLHCTYLHDLIYSCTTLYIHDVYMYTGTNSKNKNVNTSCLNSEVQGCMHVTSVYGILMLFRTANKPYNNLCTWYTSVQNLVFNFFLVFLRDLLSFNRSRWVSTPMILGKPCTWQTFRNSKISISNPKLASIRRRTWYNKKKLTL